MLFKAFILFYFCINICNLGFGSKILPEKTEIYTHLPDFIQKYLNKYCISAVVDSNAVGSCLDYLEPPKRIITNITNANKLIQSFGDFVFIQNSIESLVITLTGFNKSQNWHSTSKFLILVRNLTESDLKTVFKQLWIFNIYNAVVSTDFKVFFTWFPYSKENNCGKNYNIIKVETMDPFIGKIPKKLNFCTFNITIGPTLVYFDETTKTGVYATLAKTIQKQLNLNLNLINVHDYIERLTKDDSYDLFIYDMVTYNIDAGFNGALYSRRIPDYECEYTRAVSRDYVYLISPPRQIIEPNMVIVFPYNLYFPLLAVFIISVVIWKILVKIKLKDAIFSMYRLYITMGIEMTNVISLKSVSVFLAFLFFFVYHICTFHQTKLSSVLASPQLTPKVKNLNQFLKSNYIFKCEPYVIYALMPRGEEIFREVEKRHVIITNMMNELGEFLEDPTYYGFAAITIYLRLVKNLKYAELMLDDPLASTASHIVLTKNHPLYSRIDRLIQNILEAGLMDKWIADFSMENTNVEYKFYQSVNRKLSIANLQSCFFFLITGLTVSFCVFMGELLFTWYISLKIRNWKIKAKDRKE
ncbi:Ionotropic receptor 176 [Diabrotica virgifera virgifera]|nr:Ionotropic receptor 176 [Diabrotica virgifera virgifera]